ncbi:hypothetical protein V2J09_016250 [Rumex salicifolius]
MTEASTHQSIPPPPNHGLVSSKPHQSLHFGVHKSPTFPSPFAAQILSLSPTGKLGSKMSCNGCRVLRKGCSDACILRPCLLWIPTPEAQGHATVFVAKFFGRAGLMSFISNVPNSQRPALFQSLLYEACGRTVNPVSGAVGLLWTGNWQICQTAVDTVLRGGTVHPLPGSDDLCSPHLSSVKSQSPNVFLTGDFAASPAKKLRRPATPSLNSGASGTTVSFEGGSAGDKATPEPKLLDLFF